MPRTRQPAGRAALLSVIVHGALLALLLWNPTTDPDGGAPSPSVGGGGGGGGGPRITYVALGAYVPSAAAAAVPEIAVPRLAASHQVRDVVVFQRVPDLRAPSVRPALARAIGAGPGLGGGPGAGTGTGGGAGSGEGTGQGSGMGPGSGGGPGDILPPTVRFTALPPFDNRPASVRGRSFRVYFTVDRLGQVLDVTVEPLIEDATYRKQFLDAMRRYRFHPASLPDGTTVPGRAVVSVTL